MFKVGFNNSSSSSVQTYFQNYQLYELFQKMTTRLRLWLTVKNNIIRLFIEVFNNHIGKIAPFKLMRLKRISAHLKCIKNFFSLWNITQRHNIFNFSPPSPCGPFWKNALIGHRTSTQFSISIWHCQNLVAPLGLTNCLPTKHSN